MAETQIAQCAPRRANVGLAGGCILRYQSGRTEPLRSGHVRDIGQSPLFVSSLERIFVGKLREPASDQREAL